MTPPNKPLGASIVEQAMEKNKKRSESTLKGTVDDAAAETDSPKAQPTDKTVISQTVSATTAKVPKGVKGAKGVKLQPVQAKLKPTLYKTHQKTIAAVNEITESNITSADIMRASVHLLSKMKADKILQAIKETAI